MAVIRVIGGTLWQWDVDRQVECPARAEEAHFALVGTDTAYCTLPDDDGLADVPNVLLQDGRAIECWATDEGRTLGGARLHVERRAKPPTYVYTATDVESVESVVQAAVEEALEGLSVSYESLEDLPTIEGTEVVGDLTFADFGAEAISAEDIEALFEENG